MKKESRAASLASKRAIDSSGTSNREELLRSSAVREKQDLNEKVACVMPLHHIPGALLKASIAKMRS